MSLPVFAVHPISLRELAKIILTTPTCIGSPFASSTSCSQPLIRSPSSKRLPNAKEKLDCILRSVKDDIVAITKDNISNLKYIAKSCTCSDHQKLSANFAHHWLASPRISQFLNYMSWSTDTAKWRCLAPENLSCTSMLDCLNSTEIHHDICGFLNKMAIGVELHKSLLQLARHWFCKKHQEDDNTFSAMVDNLWQDCCKYWNKLGYSPRRQRISDLKVTLGTDPEEDSTVGDSSLLSGSSDIAGSTENIDLEGAHKSSRISQNDTDHDAELQQDASPPWNDQNLYEEDNEDSTLGDSDPSTIQCSQFPENPRISYPELQLEISDNVLPGTFPEETVVVNSGLAPMPVPAPVPGVFQTALINSSVQPNAHPIFKHYHSANDEEAFQLLFDRLKEEPPSRSGKKDEGFIYVLQSTTSPSHVKVGQTGSPNERR